MNLAREQFGWIWPTHVDGLIQLMIGLRSACKGDLDTALIIAIIGSAMLPRGKVPANLTYDEFRQRVDRETYTLSVNAHSVAQIAGIPRETARRKVKDLIALGWVKIDERGNLIISEKGRDELQPMTEYSLEYLSKIISSVKNRVA